MTHGMIVAPQPEAVEAGAIVLRDGGNAVDAAIACALVQTAVDPMMCGIAGFGSMHLYLPGQGLHGLIDFHTKAPAAVTENMWEDLIEGECRDGFGFILKGRPNEMGYQSIMIPGSIKAYHEAVTEYGTMDWKDIVQPAIDYAREGFTVRPHIDEFWSAANVMGRVSTAEKLKACAATKRIYTNGGGEFYGVGDRIANPDMVRSLERVQDGGADAFYSGELADDIVADLEANGALLSREDLAGYRTVRPEPIWGEYRGHRVASNPPPGGGVMVIQMLHILENFDLEAMGHNSPDYIATVAEAMKYATIDKDTRIGDPDFFDVPMDELLGKDYAAGLADRIKAGERAHVERLGEPEESKDTTHLCVADEAGNVVTMTHSLGMPSGVITEGLGFMYNGCMGAFDPRPGRAASIAPGKGRFTAMSPTIVFKGDEPYVAIGAPGGTFITMGVLQGILNVLDFGMSMAEAVAAPRFTANSDTIDVSNRIPRFVTNELADRGYPIQRSPFSYVFAGVHGIKIEDGNWTGGADPGRDGMALAV